MPCKHLNCDISVELLGKKTYYVRCDIETRAHIVKTEPVSMRVVTDCPDCHFGSIYNASSSTVHRGATAWPTWLCERMRTLAEIDAALRRACIVCHVPGITEEA